MWRSNLFQNKTSETDMFCNELWKDLDTSKENVPEQRDENLRMEEFMYLRPHLPRGVVNHQFRQYHNPGGLHVRPWNNSPRRCSNGNSPHRQARNISIHRLRVGLGSKRDRLGLEVFLNKNPNMILRKFYLLDQLVIFIQNLQSSSI